MVYRVPFYRYAVFDRDFGVRKSFSRQIYGFYFTFGFHCTAGNHYNIVSRSRQRNRSLVDAAYAQNYAACGAFIESNFVIRNLSARNNFGFQRYVAARGRGDFGRVKPYIVFGFYYVYLTCKALLPRRNVDKRRAVFKRGK